MLSNTMQKFGCVGRADVRDGATSHTKSSKQRTLDLVDLVVYTAMLVS